MKLMRLIRETNFFDRFKRKNKWMELLRTDKERLKQELFVLVNNSYAPLGGHPRISGVDSILDPQLTYWEGVDDDNDPNADAVLFGKETPYGVKISGMGQDGGSRAKSDLVNKLVAQLKRPGYWIEVSDRPAEILLGKGAPYLDDQKKVEKIFNQEVEWLNDKGWYIRTVNSAGKRHKEIVMGKPKV
jgi:hypothetical protein